MSTRDDTHTRLTTLANRLSRLRPDWRSAEKFYEERSELKAEALAIANSPTMVKTVTKFVRILSEPAPAQAPQPAPAQAAADVAAPDGSFPLILTGLERQVLRTATTRCNGGFGSSFKRWDRNVDPNTGVLIMTPYDVARAWDWGSRPWKGGAQSYTRKIFWRSLGMLFESLGMSPETGEVASKPNPHRRFSKKPEKATDNGQDTPHQDAQDGAQAESGPGQRAADEGRQDAPEGQGGPCAS